MELLGQHAPDARVLAGGQSLVPMMNFRLARPDVLVDLNRISDLSYIRDDGDCLAIGAMTRERTIENSDLVKSACPLVHDATLNIAHLPIRSRGTIGGSIANADPAAISSTPIKADPRAAENRNLSKKMVGDAGIEPATPSMSTKCSPAELIARVPEKAARFIVFGNG